MLTFSRVHTSRPAEILHTSYMRNTIIIISVVIFFSLLAVFVAFNRENTTNKNSILEDVVQPDLKTTFNEWVKCKNREVPTGFQVTWKIKLKSISTFGGLYGKGHIEGNKSYTVHLRWDTESEFYKYRRPRITRGDILIMNGTFWGISENGDVIIDVKHMKVIK